MNYFAEVNIENMITRVIVAEADNLPPLSVNGDKWIQTYKDGTRGQYAGIGFFWNVEHSIFVEPQLYPSWTLNITTGAYDPPIAKPSNSEDMVEEWNEDNQYWERLNYMDPDNPDEPLNPPAKQIWDTATSSWNPA